MSADADAPLDVFVRGPATWYSWLLTGAFIFLFNVQGNVVPFLQEEFALSYRAVSLHSSGFAMGIIVVGIFILGLGIAPLFPLSTNFAVGAAPEATDLASVRLVISMAVALLLAPMILGGLADQVGLGPAHLALPALMVVAYVVFLFAEVLQKRSAAVAPT